MLLRILYDFPYRERSRTQKRKMRCEDEYLASGAHFARKYQAYFKITSFTAQTGPARSRPVYNICVIDLIDFSFYANQSATFVL